MNRKQFSILLVLVVILGGAGIMVYNKQNQERKGGQVNLGRKLLADLAVNDVARIVIRQDANALNLVKKDGLWRVAERKDYPANFSDISDLVVKLGNLKIVQVEQVGPSQLPRLSLTTGQGTNSGVQVELKDKDAKNLHTLLLGKKHLRKSNRPSPMGDMGDDAGFPDGRYVKVGDAKDVALISDPLANIEPKPEQWLSKDFFKVEKLRAVSVEYPDAATNSWKLTRETEQGEWKLADAKEGEQLDATKVSGLAGALSAPSFVDVVVEPQPEALGLAKPTVMSVETFDHLNYTIKVGQKTNDQLPLMVSVSAQLPKERTPGKDEKPEDKEKLDKAFKDEQKKLEEKLVHEKTFEPWTYVVSSWTLDALLKERSQLFAEKKDASEADSAPHAGVDLGHEMDASAN